MALFLSEEEQLFTDPVFSVGLGFIHKNKWLDIITANMEGVIKIYYE